MRSRIVWARIVCGLLGVGIGVDLGGVGGHSVALAGPLAPLPLVQPPSGEQVSDEQASDEQASKTADIEAPAEKQQGEEEVVIAAPLSGPSPADADADRVEDGEDDEDAEVSAATRRKLGPFLAAAETGLRRFDTEIDGYTCLLIKRERIDGDLSDHQFLWMKVRERRERQGELITPQSVYIRFLKPAYLAGREILYVENERNGQALARKGGRRLPNLTLTIRPDSPVALAQSRQPVTRAGLRFLLEDLVDSMRNRLDHSQCVLNEYQSAQMDGRPCRHFEVRQLVRKPDAQFHTARVLLDEQLRLPVYFASYDWPEEPGGKPVLQEEYIFTRLKLNPGLSDDDFRRDHPEYHFAEEDDAEPDEQLKQQLADPEASKRL